MATENNDLDTSKEEDQDVDTSSADQSSLLELSDADFLKLPVPGSTPVAAKPAEAAKTTPTTPVDDDAEGGDDAAGEAQAAEKPADAAGETKPAAEKPAAEVKTDKTEKPATPETPKVEEKPADSAALDYKAEYERLLAPFKANGRDVKVDSVDDAIALMQMGANYNKKMAGLKPNLKLLKLLENNGFLDEQKIGYLIDLGKKNPAAIQRLVQESGIDPMELDAEKAKAYKQTAYAVDDREIELDTVLDELQGSPSYTRTLDLVSNKWDVASKRVISESPQLLKVINDHIASGIYDRISTEVERGRMLGRLSGLSDIEAYRQVGDSIQARGGFNDLVGNKPPVATKPAEPVIVVPTPKKVDDDDKLKDKRRAASSTKPAAPTGVPADFNPLALSDAEFSKLAVPKFR